MNKSLIIQTSLWLAVFGLTLFLSAGSLAYVGGWVFLAEMTVGSFVMGVWLGRHDPQLLQERFGSLVSQPDQKTWDRFLIGSFAILFYVWLGFMAWDAGRNNFALVPAWLQALGALGVALYMVVGWLTLRENSFAAPVIKIQEGQKVISTGPYALVRHPLYTGALLLFVGLPLLLGSWLGLIGTAVLIVMVGVRAVLEEHTLRRELDGYDAYAARVRYRFIPLIW